MADFELVCDFIVLLRWRHKLMIEAQTLDMMICWSSKGMLHFAWQLTASTYASEVNYQAEHGFPSQINKPSCLRSEPRPSDNSILLYSFIWSIKTYIYVLYCVSISRNGLNECWFSKRVLFQMLENGYPNLSKYQLLGMKNLPNKSDVCLVMLLFLVCCFFSSLKKKKNHFLLFWDCSAMFCHKSHSC